MILKINRKHVRSKHLPLPAPTGGTDETRRQAAYLIAILQPPNPDESWIGLEEVAAKVSQQRPCYPREVAAALHGNQVPPPEIFDAVISLRTSRRHEKAGEHNQADADSPPRMRKPLRWAAGIAGAALITLIVSGVFPNALEQIFDGSKIDDKIHRGPDIIANVSTYYPDGASVPVPAVVPGNYHVPAELIQAMSHPMAATSKSVVSQMRQASGIDVGATFIRVILQGNRREPVSVLGIALVNLHRNAPLNGVLFDVGGQGEVSNINVGFNLDQPFPQALKVDQPDTLTNQPFFRDDTISLPDGKPNILILQADTNCYSASFDLSVRYTVGSSQHTELITDRGKPFQVSASRLSWGGYLSYRQDFELQGNFSIIPKSYGKVPGAFGAQLQAARACPYLATARH